MTVAVVLQAIATATFVAGAIFTIVQLRLSRVAREREVALEILRVTHSVAFARALRTVYELEPGLSRAQIMERVGPGVAELEAMMHSWESLGVLVYRRQLDISLVEDFVSGSLLLSWRKLEGYVREERIARGRSTLFEWFQWLAERMLEREQHSPAVPAFEAHRNWRP